jgi:hypothetical protein
MKRSLSKLSKEKSLKIKENVRKPSKNTVIQIWHIYKFRVILLRKDIIHLEVSILIVIL